MRMLLGAKVIFEIFPDAYADDSTTTDDDTTTYDAKATDKSLKENTNEKIRKCYRPKFLSGQKSPHWREHKIHPNMENEPTRGLVQDSPPKFRSARASGKISKITLVANGIHTFRVPRYSEMF